MIGKFDELYERIMGNYPAGMSKSDMAHVEGEGTYSDQLDWILYDVVEDLGDKREVELRANDGKNEYSKKAIEIQPYDKDNYTEETDMEWVSSMD